MSEFSEFDARLADMKQSLEHMAALVGIAIMNVFDPYRDARTTAEIEIILVEGHARMQTLVDAIFAA